MINIQKYNKAIVAGIGAAIVVIGPFMPDIALWMENNLTQEWIRNLTVLLTTAGVVYVKNKEGDDVHS